MEKEKLKTLKEIPHFEDVNGEGYREGISRRILRAEAIKWVKKWYKYPNSAVAFKKFFNLTEEDLK